MFGFVVSCLFAVFKFGFDLIVIALLFGLVVGFLN